MDSVAGMRTFVRVVESGSFSAAGRQLGAAASSISRQVNDLEDELGARLFHRTTRRLSLTEAGRLYYERAARILIEVDEAKLAVAEMGEAPSGILRLTVPSSIARLHLIPAMAAFQERRPAVHFALTVTDRLVNLVEEGFDLAIRVGRQRDSSLIARQVGASRRLVCASPGYLQRAGVPATPADLARHNCLTFRSHPGHNAWRFRAPGGTEEVRVSGSLFANDGEALCAAAAAGIGVILVPEWLVGVEIGRRRMVPVLEDFEPVPNLSPLYAVYPHQRHLPPKVRAFIDFLATRLGGGYDWTREH